MSAAPKRTLLVCGGSGFVGTQICRLASSRSWRVLSLSRSGEPSWPSTSPNPTTSTPSSSRPVWASSVEWHKGDVLNPSSYRHLLETEKPDAVVHSMGILLEADYKKIVRGEEGIIQGVWNMFGRREVQGNTVREGGAVRDGVLTYEAMNRDSAVTLCEESSAIPSVKSFVYVSAIDSFFALPKRYITTKREAEQRIAGIAEQRKGDLRPVFVRPSFIYDKNRAFTVPLAAMTGVASAVNGMVGGALRPMLGAGGYPPVRVEDVAGAVLKALEKEEVRGVVDVEGIKKLAEEVWREGML